MTKWLACAIVVFFSLLFASKDARADPLRILIAASHTRGAPGELPLSHVERDAAHVRDVLTTIGGFAANDATLLIDPTLADLDRAIAKARALASTHDAADVTLLFYFSGHGDRDRIHLGTESLTMSDLAERVRSIPANLRILVTDACRNYPTRSKGITTEPGFAIEGDAAHAKGVVWLFASSEGEVAQESDELQGALFTHYWVSGLRGAADVNGDGRVTLAESYDFAYAQTVFRSARGSGVLQHPTAMFTLREVAPVVMTETFGRGTQLRFPPSADTRYVVYAIGSRSIFGEIWSNPDHSIAMSVPSGRYIVQRRAAGSSGALEVALAAGDQRTLAPRDFRDVPEEQLASKGGDVVLRPNEIAVDVGGDVSRIADYDEALGVRYTRAFDAWALSVRAFGGIGAQHTGAQNVTLSSIGCEAFLERRFHFGRPLLAIGLGGAAEIIWQKLERVDAAQLALAGYPTTQTFNAFAPGPMSEARLQWPLAETIAIELDARSGILFPNFGGSAGALWMVGIAAGMGVSF
jgi:hypothetical protein